MDVPRPLRDALDLARSRASDGDFAKIASLLEDAVELLTKPAQGRGRGRRGLGAEYLVESLGGIEALSEHRMTGRSNALRCPKSVYDAVVHVLTTADVPLSVEEVAAALPELLSGRPAKFQIRVPLRLWMTSEQPLVIRSKARYTPTNRQAFGRLSVELWDSLKKT